MEGRGASGTRGGGVDVTESLAERSVGCVVRRRRRNGENRQCGGRPVSWRDLCLAVRATSEGDSECERGRKRDDASDASTGGAAKGDPKVYKLHTIHEWNVLTCKGGSKENRNGDPLRRAKVYIKRTHMEERACKGLWRPVLIGYRVYGADANGGRVGCRYRQGRRGDSVIASGGSEYRQERKRKAGGSGERSGSERKGAWERAEGRENGRKRERPLTSPPLQGPTTRRTR